MTTYTDAQMVDDLAQQLFVALVADAPVVTTVDLEGSTFTYTPDLGSDLYTDTLPINITSLTEVSLAGAGVFDRLMAAMDLHIQREFKGNRITGDQYAKVYTETMAGVLSSSVQFLLTKDQAHWASIAAQMQARIAKIQATEALIKLEETRILTQKATLDLKNSSAQFALTKMQIATQNAQHFLITSQITGEDYKNANMLPAQTKLIQEQVEAQRGQTLNTRSDTLTPITGLIGKQKESIALDVETKQYSLTNIMPIQLDLVKEQREGERSKTLNTRTDGTTVIGSVGKQKDLYTQQIDSFAKDAKYKTAKMYLDNWITQKTLDENIAPPTELTAATAATVLSAHRSLNGL